MTLSSLTTDPVALGFQKCWFLWRGETRSTRRKTSRSKDENQQQTQPTYGTESGNRTRPTLVVGLRGRQILNHTQHIRTLRAKTGCCLENWFNPGLREQTPFVDLFNECRERRSRLLKSFTKNKNRNNKWGYMWVEFVVSSRPCSERFSSGNSGFPNSKFDLALCHKPLAREIAQALPRFIDIIK